MDSYIFYITDTLGDTVAVVGDGEDLAEAETSAVARWVAAVDPARSVESLIYSELSTLDMNSIGPGLILA